MIKNYPTSTIEHSEQKTALDPLKAKRKFSNVYQFSIETEPN